MKKTWHALCGVLLLLTLASCRTVQPEIPEKARHELSALFPELRRLNPQWVEPRMELLPSSPEKLRLLLGGRGLSDISPLRSYEYEELILDRTGVPDLGFIKDFNIRSLMVFSEREISLRGLTEQNGLRTLSVKYLGIMHSLPKLSLKPLAGLKLRSLRIENALVSDCGGIPPSLESLTFENCLGLTDLSFLAGSRKLKTLELINCLDLRTGNMPELPVAELSLAFSPVSDPEALHSLHSLKALTLNAPERLDFLRGMKLETLSVNGNARELDIAPLADLPLRHLELSAVRISDLKPLAGCTRLEVLNLMLNGISDIEPLRGLPLEILLLAGNNIETLEPLAGCTRLNALYLTQCPVVSLEPLAALPLETLKIERCLVYDLTPVAKMPLLAFWLINCPVSDISPLRGMPVRDLMLNDCAVSDLKPLTGMPRLEKVYLRKLPALLKPLPEGIRGEIVIKEDEPNAGI